MALKRPSLTQIREIAAKLNMKISDADLNIYLELMESNFLAYDTIDGMEDIPPESKYTRSAIFWPSHEDNPLNAWYAKVTIKGDKTGPLAGKRVALKDNICIAGVPMMNGASTLKGYIPNLDATVVERILDAAGTITGKANCEYFCLSGGSHTCANGPIQNPWRNGYSAGGSSSGCAALVSAGEVDMAIGCDQGGSIRIPSSFCGVYGMKPTYGLVPYTGIMPIEATLDYAGPITNNVADNALLLESIAGSDDLDPRQRAPKIGKYTESLDRGVQNIKIGILREGFELSNIEAGVSQKVMNAAERLRSLGASVQEVSIPMHSLGISIWTPIILEGLQAQMMHGNGAGFNWKGLYNTDLLLRHQHWRAPRKTPL